MIRRMLLLSISFITLGCSKEEPKEEDFKPENYYSLAVLKKVKLSDAGKKRAKAVWDSIRPFLKTDSTVRGIEYAGEVHIGKSNNKVIWLTFDYDSTSNHVESLRFNMIPDYHKTQLLTCISVIQ